EDDWRRVLPWLPRENPWEIVGGALAAEIAPQSAEGNRWTVPLMIPVQRSEFEQEIVVASKTEPIAKVLTDGGYARIVDKAPMQIRLQEGSSSLPSSTQLSVWTRPDHRATSEREQCDEAHLITYVHKDGRIYYRAQFRLWHWRERTCAVRFPPE